MKRWLFVTGFVACAVLFLACPPAMAVTGTHHDMSVFTGAANKDTCYPCHGYKQLTYDAQLGTIGSLCYQRCHASATGNIATGITIQDAKAEVGQWTDNTIRSVTYEIGTDYASKYKAHGMTNASMPGTDNALYNGSGAPSWPYTGTKAERMQCTSCHDVHSNTNTPFLRAPLSNDATPASSFCMACHSSSGPGGRWTVMGQNQAPNGAHPVEVGATGNLWTGDLYRKGRAIALKEYAVPQAVNDNAVFSNWTYAKTDLNDPAKHYNPGGKLGNANQTGQTGKVGCYTCHAVHIPTTMTTPPTDGIPQQLLVSNWKMQGTRTRSGLCVGCHGDASTDGRNPGRTGFFHPVNGEVIPVSYTAPNGTYTTTAGWNIVVNVGGDNTDVGTGGMISCSSCHGNTNPTSKQGVHELADGKFLLNPAKPACSSCHSGGPYTSPAAHHPYGGDITNGSVWTGQGFRPTIQWNATQSATISNGLSCDDCHVFNGTAHNWN